jgi:hypothetical protein
MGKLNPFQARLKLMERKLMKKITPIRILAVYAKRGNQLNSADMHNGEMTKPPVPGRKIRRCIAI